MHASTTTPTRSERRPETVAQTAAVHHGPEANTIAEWIERSLPSSCHAVRIVHADRPTTERSWMQVHRGARKRAALLDRLGVAPGHRVAVLGSTSLELIETLLAVWLRGATVVVLPLPQRLGTAEAFAESTRTRIQAAEVHVVAADAEHLSLVGDFPPDVHAERLSSEAPDLAPIATAAIDPESTAIVQFTSGSTGRPKAVLIPHRAVTANLRAIAAAVALTSADRSVSWLPLYHDMGLIGLFLGSSVSGIDATFIPTSSFMKRPGLWMRTVADLGATVTAGPNFAYGLAARLLERARDIDLSSLRVALCGAEPVVPSIVRSFVDAGVRHGLRADVVVPCYGLAEATLAVSIARPNRPLRVDVVDRHTLTHLGIARPAAPGAPSVASVALGLPVPGTSVQVVDEHEMSLPDRRVGELLVASSSVMSGYLGDRSPVTTDGWLRTGDLVYLADGEVHVCGRVKDLIIVNGQNIHPHQVEAAAGAVDGVRMGGAVAFGVEDSGREVVVVLCESRTRGARADALVAEVRRQVLATVGVAPKHVVLVPLKSIPKTSSGKVQRHEARGRFLADAFGRAAVDRGRP